MSNIIHFPCDVIPTTQRFPRPWLLDHHGQGGITRYECAWGQINGRWQLYITKPNTHYPWGQDFTDGDTLEVMAPDGAEWDKGSIAVYTSIVMMAGMPVTTYSYTSDMTGLVP